MYKLIFILLFFPSCNYANDINLENVTVHLFLEKSGIFSKDIMTTKEFYTHNFIPSGDGIPDNEIFHSYLIKVLFSSDKEIFKEGEVAQLNIINDLNHKIVLNKNITDLYIGPEKSLYKSFFVSGQECNYQTLTVTTKKNTITQKLPFHCGE